MDDNEIFDRGFAEGHRAGYAKAVQESYPELIPEMTLQPGDENYAKFWVRAHLQGKLDTSD